MKAMLATCNSLISLPDILKWDTSKELDIEFMFYEAINILNIYPEYMNNNHQINYLSFLHYLNSIVIYLEWISMKNNGQINYSYI